MGFADKAAQVMARIRLSDLIGGDVKLRRVGRDFTGLCPFHHERRDGAFTVNDDKGFYHCFACGAHGDAIDYVVARGRAAGKGEALNLLAGDAGIDWTNAEDHARALADREARRRADEAAAMRRQANAWRLWMHSPKGMGTPAQRYLEGRGIDFARLGRFPGAIRFRHDLWNGERGGPMPGMVTAVQALDGTTCAVHRTFLAFGPKGWGKAPLDRAKMVMGPFAGAHIPLWKGESDAPLSRIPAGTPVAISEGIEDGLSVAMADPSRRVLAAISLDNIGNVKLPPQAGDVTILCQRDGDVRAARAAAAMASGDPAEAERHEQAAQQIQAALERAIEAQWRQADEQQSPRRVLLAWPQPGYKDFNDQLRGLKMAEGGA